MEENINQEDYRNKKWLEEVSEQSWNPELIISGFAIYATFSLPKIIQEAFNTYTVNYQINEGMGNAMMPALISAILISASQILSIAFIVHFILRGFWVGFLGVISVYPKGIDFNRITVYGDYGKEKLKAKMQNLDVLAEKLDKAASIVFALAIMIILQLIGICLMYSLFIILYNIFQNLLGKALYEKYENLLLFAFLTFVMIPTTSVIILGQKRFKNHPKYGKWHYHFATNFQKIFLPFFGDHIQSLLLTFNSTVSQRRINMINLFVGICFMFMMAFNLFSLRGVSPLNLHHFYTSYTRETFLLNNYYENQRSLDVPRTFTIQSDIITEPYVRLFIAYHKKNDEFLDSLCTKTSSKKIKDKYLNRIAEDEQKLQCLQSAYKIQLNDSTFAKNEFMYYEFDDAEKGVVMHIPSKICKKGKNQIKIIARKHYKPDTRPYEALITFWY
ncbi:hypothetical protein AD998_08925 [bacterium 336/3]|nr:hypothetical protein AD998_08925 [bacterium 336/3]